MTDPDVVVIGSGPNGLSAAVELALHGASVRVLEQHSKIGGGTRTEELTLPGFQHDVCSAVHPMGVLSPYLRTLPLGDHGLEWIRPSASVAHPLDDGTAVLLTRSVAATAGRLGVDATRYRKLVEPFLHNPHGLLRDALAPLGIPRHPVLMTRFGLHGMRSANGLANRFQGDRARALLAGCAGHSILPLDKSFSAAIALMFMITGHVDDWPVAAGGSQAITAALASLLRANGGHLETGFHVQSIDDLPAAKMWIFDTSPDQLARIAAPVLPDAYARRLLRYRYGPGVYKLDWALDQPIPWRDPRCREASTVHVGGTLEEIADAEAAVWRGEHPERPFLILCQQSEFDRSRAPDRKHTGYAYCHVPAESTIDLTAVVENQVERFAPGFKDCILARHSMNAADFQTYNPNFVGGAITGGVADYSQLFTRPVARLNPYTTPNRRILICSASTPPGGGVHGMCGYHAAQAALKTLGSLSMTKLSESQK